MKAIPDTSLSRPSRMPTLVYLVSEDWFFATHFLPLARAAKAKGFRIVIITRLGRFTPVLQAEGFDLIDFSASRSSFGPAGLIRAVAQLRAIFRREKPTLIHAIALKSVVLGGVAARLAGGVPAVYSLTGLGYLWSTPGLAPRVLRSVVKAILRLLDRPSAAFSFENEDDCAEFPTLRSRTVIGGWGMEPAEIEARPQRDAGPVRVVYLGRMLKAKGIEAAVRAVELARETVDIELELWGAPDPGNLTSLTEADLLDLSKRPGIRWFGKANSAQDVWARADIAILLSDREGMPRSLIEASSASLPLVAYDVAGCRSIVQNGVSGYLLPHANEIAVAEALVRLASDSRLRQRMGAAARTHFEARFTVERTVPRLLGIYFDLVPQPEMG